MPAPMFRKDFQELSRIRLREAKHLLGLMEYSGAYHFVGIAVECGLKACIAKRVKRHQFPDKQANKSYSHDLKSLVRLAELDQSLEDARKADLTFDVNWSIVNDWSIESRYEVIGKAAATQIYSAAVSKRGVMQWIRKNW